MDFIDQIDLEATAGRRVLHVIQQIAGIFDFGARSGIDLYQIDKAPLFYFTAVIADAAWRGGNTGFTV